MDESVGQALGPDEPTVPSAACPLLALAWTPEGDQPAASPRTTGPIPDLANRCAGVASPRPIGLLQQELVCLGAAHVDCPLFVRAARSSRGRGQGWGVRVATITPSMTQWRAPVSSQVTPDATSPVDVMSGSQVDAAEAGVAAIIQEPIGESEVTEPPGVAESSGVAEPIEVAEVAQGAEMVAEEPSHDATHEQPAGERPIDQPPEVGLRQEVDEPRTGSAPDARERSSRADDEWRPPAFQPSEPASLTLFADMAAVEHRPDSGFLSDDGRPDDWPERAGANRLAERPAGPGFFDAGTSEETARAGGAAWQPRAAPPAPGDAVDGPGGGPDTTRRAAASNPRPGRVGIPETRFRRGRSGAHRSRRPTPIMAAAAILVGAVVLAFGYVSLNGGLALPSVSPGPGKATGAPTATSEAQTGGSPGAQPTSTGPTGSSPSAPPSPTPTAPAASPGPGTSLPPAYVGLTPCTDMADCYQYRVRSGDNLTRIANHFAIDLNALKAANREITNPSLLHPGAVLRIPLPKP